MNFWKEHREAKQFVRDVDRILAGGQVPEDGREIYRQDLALAQKLSRLHYQVHPQFKARLWNRLIHQVESKEGNPMKRQGRFRMHPVWVAVAALLIAVTVFLATPAGRSIAQSLLGRFVEVGSPWDLLHNSPEAQPPLGSGFTEASGKFGEPMSSPSDQPLSNVGPEDGAAGSVSPPQGISLPSLPRGLSFALQLISLEEAQKTCPFTIAMPTTLPEGYTFKGVLSLPTPPQTDNPSPTADLPFLVTLVFENKSGDLLTLTEARLPIAVEMPIGKGSGQEVTVNGRPGLYIQGAWTPEGWDQNANYHQLHWEGEDGLSYDLISAYLGLEELLKVAESIQ